MTATTKTAKKDGKIPAKFAAMMPKRVPRKVDFNRLTTFLYGKPKVGKSTFAAQFKDPIFLPTEPGLNSLEVRQIPPDGSGISSWDQFGEILDLLESGHVEGQTIIIDTIDNLYKFATEALCKARGIKHPSDLPHGKGWSMLANTFENAIRRLLSMPFGVVMISHGKEIQDTINGVERTRVAPTLTGAAAKITLGLSDLVIYCDLEAVPVANGAIEFKRYMRTKPSRSYEAGDRTGALPASMPLDFSIFAKEFKAGIARVVSAGHAPVIEANMTEAGAMQKSDD